MSRLLDKCGSCGSDQLASVLHLGSSPATCNMRKVGERWAAEEHHPLELLRCGDCTLVQLSVIVDPAEVFPPDYPYSSGNSKALHDNFQDLADSVDVGRNHLVVDIGANDGTLLSKFDRCRTVGIEPTDQVQKVKGSAYQAFFTEQLARQIREEHGPAKVVTACNVLAHVDDIHDVMRGIAHLLADDGVLVAENHDLRSVVDGQWDTVYHEHLRYFDPHGFGKLLRRHGLGLRRYHSIQTHGGSFRAIAHHGTGIGTQEPSYDFERLERIAWYQRRELRDDLLSRDVVYGIGATARATTIINYCGLDVEDIVAVCEVAGSDKIGRYIPGTRIPVIGEQELFDYPEMSAILFSWHLADLIIPKLRERGYQGDIILPLQPAVAA